MIIYNFGEKMYEVKQGSPVVQIILEKLPYQYLRKYRTLPPLEEVIEDLVKWMKNTNPETMTHSRNLSSKILEMHYKYSYLMEKFYD